MNAEDKFEARHQEIHDENTGVTVTFGSHAGSSDSAPEGHLRKGLKWLRIAVPYGTPDGGVETRTSTITFGPDGHTLKILPHVQADPTGPVDHESVADDDSTDNPDKVDKYAKRGKK